MLDHKLGPYCKEDRQELWFSFKKSHIAFFFKVTLISINGPPLAALSRNVLICSWLPTLTLPYTPQAILHPSPNVLSTHKSNLIGLIKYVGCKSVFNKLP